MIGAVLRWLPVSLALHAVVLGAALMLPGVPALAPLFVDLTLAPVLADPAPERRAPGPPRRPELRPAAPAAARRQDTMKAAAPPRSPARSPGGAPARVDRPVAAPSLARPATEAAPTTPPSSVVPRSTDEPSPSVVPPPSVPSPPPVVAADPPATSAAPAPAPPAATVEPSAPAASAPAERTPSPVAGDGLTTARADDAGGAVVDSGGSSAAPASGEGGGTAATAPPAGDGPLALAVPGDGGGAYASYLALLHRRVQEAMTYPAAARRRGLSGTVHLEIALEPSGVIRDVTLTRSSSHGVLDDAAVDAVRALRRVPFPPDVRARALRVRLPVVFELR